METYHSLEILCKKIPKAELHLHIEGSLSPELMFKLAQKNKIKLPYSSVEAVYQAYQFNNLQSFLDIYYAGANVLQTEDDFYQLGMDYFLQAHSDGVKHAEIFFDPQTHTERGISFATVVEGLARAQAEAKSKYKISSFLIMCFLRHLSEADAQKTLQQAMPYLKYIKGVGLDSSEKGHPPEKFERVFAEARALGLIPVAHAGEEGPAEYIWSALEKLKVVRIDHGVRCDEDPQLLAYLVQKQIPLTVCPLSNLKLCVVKNLSEHNLKRLLDKNLCITINSDDPTYFGGFIADNYLKTARALNLSVSDIVKLAANSFKASWLSESEKQVYLQALV